MTKDIINQEGELEVYYESKFKRADKDHGITVGELKRLLDHFSNDAQVVLCLEDVEIGETEIQSVSRDSDSCGEVCWLHIPDCSSVHKLIKTDY